MILLDVEALDWNCPQHITQRFTQEELQEVIGPQLERLAALEAEVKVLRALKNG